MAMRLMLSWRRNPAVVFLWVLILLAGTTSAADFQIVWVDIGDAETSSGDGSARAGRHLFMASDLTDMSLKQIVVARVDVTPVISALAVGQRFCLTSLRMEAAAPDGSLVKQAPLSVAVRQDHRDALAIERGKDDICMRPIAEGEYPVRFTSVLPAKDGTARGAQIFLRVSNGGAAP
ncbi:MAG TPA: hypothetical protein VIT67_03760 [Povalibacter sp.]